MMKKRKKIILLLMLSILFAVAGLVKIFLDKMNCSVVESGKANVEVVVEQIQQTYELQIESFYSRMRVIDAYVAQGNTEILEITNAMNLFESWQKETGAQIFFIKENGSATTIDKKDLRLEISSTLLMDLRAGRNIAKLISYNDDVKTETGFLMAIPCSEYYIDGEAYTTIGALVDRSDIDSVLKLYAYGGEAFLYMLDASGDVIYTNRQDEKLFQNYSLLKHLKKENVLTDEQAAFLEKEFEEQHHGTELFGEDKAYYLGYCPGDNNNSTLVCIVPMATVDNALMSYQKTFFYTTLFTAMFVFLLLAGLCCSLARIHMAKQRIMYEKKTRKQQQQNLKELESLNEELKEAQTAATEALQSAEIANKAKSDFLSNISHDIRTPMNAIIGITSLIKHDADNEAKVLEDIKKIEISSQNLLEIINDVLDMNKIESGKATLAYTDFSIYELIQEVDVLFRPQTDAKHQTFEIITENIRHEWLNGDKVRLMQIFSNLLSNAVKYTQKSGKIQFYIEEYSTGSSAYAKYRFLVKDNGMGMDAAFQDKIFDAFTREERSLTNKIQGTGLGMAITKNLIGLMGGSIDVESEKDLGSCFEILLDIKIAEDSTVLPMPQEQNEAPDAELLKGMNFLCAEDNELNAEILKELLKMEGAECTICENGKKILEAFQQSRCGDYDAILMDVQMPVMNGYEATKAIRNSSHELAKDIPIIAMTANAFSEDIQASLAAGMNAHISKPVDIETLAKTIKTIKSQPGGVRRL